MATIVDTLVTKYVLDGKQYQQGAQDVSQATSGMSAALGKSGIGFAAVITGVTTAAAAVAAFGKTALDHAISFDTLSRQMNAVTGSASRTAEILRFVDDLAVPSIFGQAELADAAKLLEAFGLNTEKYLPIVEKLGTVFGGTAQDVKQFADALGYINAGRTGEGLEALARAGISRDQLVKRGMTFDKGGSFTGDKNALLKAVRDETNARFGTLAKEMADGPAAKLASLGDLWDKSLRRVGQTLLTSVLPTITKVVDSFQLLLDKGYVDQFATAIGLIIDEFTQAAEFAIAPMVKILDILGIDFRAGASGRKLAARIKAGDEYNEAHGLGQYAGQSTVAIQSEQVRTLKAIEQNTAPIREMMSYIFGGGELGRAGVGVTSMRGSRSHTSVHRQVMAMTNMGLMRR